MKISLYICALLILAGCSGKPSSNEMAQQIEASLQGNGGADLFKIENFQKLNGFEKDNNTYIADVRYDLVFKKGIKEIAQQLQQDAKTSPLGTFAAGFGVLALQMQYGEFKAGHRVPKEDKVTFIHTENGWRIDEASH